MTRNEADLKALVECALDDGNGFGEITKLVRAEACLGLRESCDWTRGLLWMIVRDNVGMLRTGTRAFKAKQMVEAWESRYSRNEGVEA